jgi:hypothetical protein
MQIRSAVPKDIRAIQRPYRQLDAHHVDLCPSVFKTVDGDPRPEK